MNNNQCIKLVIDIELFQQIYSHARDMKL